LVQLFLFSSFSPFSTIAIWTDWSCTTDRNVLEAHVALPSLPPTSIASQPPAHRQGEKGMKKHSSVTETSTEKPKRFVCPSQVFSRRDVGRAGRETCVDMTTSACAPHPFDAVRDVTPRHIPLRKRVCRWTSSKPAYVCTSPLRARLCQPTVAIPTVLILVALPQRIHFRTAFHLQNQFGLSIKDGRLIGTLSRDVWYIALGLHPVCHCGYSAFQVTMCRSLTIDFSSSMAPFGYGR